jgi:hypothetical protein
LVEISIQRDEHILAVDCLLQNFLIGCARQSKIADVLSADPDRREVLDRGSRQALIEE